MIDREKLKAINHKMGELEAIRVRLDWLRKARDAKDNGPPAVAFSDAQNRWQQITLPPNYRRFIVQYIEHGYLEQESQCLLALKSMGVDVDADQ